MVVAGIFLYMDMELWMSYPEMIHWFTLKVNYEHSQGKTGQANS